MVNLEHKMPEHTLPPFMLPQAVAITFASGIFLGLFLISVAFANRWLILADDGWSFKKGINWYTLITTNIIAVVVLVEQAANVNTSISESSYVDQGYELGEYIESPWRIILKCTIFNVIALIADAVLMYRLWHVCRRRMSVMWFPFFLWIGGLVCLAMETVIQVKYLDNPNFGRYEYSTINTKVGPGIVIVPFLASTIVLNAYCTGLLIWRIWKTLKSHDSGSSSMAKQLRFLIRVLMESGVLYLSITIVNFVVYFGPNSFVIYMVNMLRVVLIGIAYNLIIIRVGQNRSEEDEYSPSGGKVSTLIFSNSRTDRISTT